MTCTYSDSTGHICKFPGVFSHSLHGSNTWRCIWHWRLSNDATGPSDARINGDEIVRQSYEWDGKKESFWEMRSRAGKGQIRAAHEGIDRVDGIPGSLDQVVQEVQFCSSGLEDWDMR